MADKLADLSPEEKEKRIAELKANMQASAKKNKAAAAAAAGTTAPPTPEPAVAEAAAPIAAAPVAATTAEPVAAATATPEPKPEVVTATNGGAANGAAAGVTMAPAAVSAEPVFVEDTPEQKAKKNMNRREFLTYAWGGALVLLALEAGAGTFFFMYPRFKAGEFGGVFYSRP